MHGDVEKLLRDLIRAHRGPEAEHVGLDARFTEGSGLRRPERARADRLSGGTPSHPLSTDGRREATRRGIATTGTLGVLNDASERGSIDLPTALDHLGRTTFRVPPGLLKQLLDRERGRQGES